MRTLAIPALLLGLLLAAPAVNADFTDSNYHQYILYNMDQTEVDVLILPSASPYALRDSTLMMQSIQAWDDGINSLGPAWLANGLNIHAYRVGVDTIPQAALADPEIVVVPAEFNPVLLFGIGLEAMNNAGLYYCYGGAPSMVSAQGLTGLPGYHTHPGSTWGSVQAANANASGRGCAKGGTTCFVINTNFLDAPSVGNRRDMYDLNSHEFGHCLGIGHVGDALDFTAANYPQDDIMSYETDGHDAYHVLCVSTLDILGLKTVYGWLLGQTGYSASPADTFVAMAPSSWSTVSCAEPTAGVLGLAADKTLAGKTCPAGLGVLC